MINQLNAQRPNEIASLCDQASIDMTFGGMRRIYLDCTRTNKTWIEARGVSSGDTLLANG